MFYRIKYSNIQIPGVLANAVQKFDPDHWAVGLALLVLEAHYTQNRYCNDAEYSVKVSINQWVNLKKTMSWLNEYAASLATT